MTAEQFPNSFVAAGVADTTLSASYTPGDGVLHVSSVPTGVGLTGAAFRVKVGGTIYRVTDLGSSPFLDWLIPAGPLEGTADASHGAGDDVFLDFTRGSLEDGIRSLDAITETDETANGWPNSVPKASTTFPPAAHATTHEPGGSDPMDVDAIAATGSLRTLGTASTQAAAGNDARLSNARTPTAHAASHQDGGSDEVATVTPAADAIPKADAFSKLALGWLSLVLGLVDLTDVDFSTPATTGQALVFDGTNWVPGTVATSSGGHVLLDDGDPGAPVTDDTGDWLYDE